MSKRLLVVDDHPVVRMGLVAMLSEHEEFEVVGHTALRGTRRASQERPHAPATHPLYI